MRPAAEPNQISDPIEEALAWHQGDARACIATLLADCAYLRYQIEVADRAMSRGFTRGWRPCSDRD